MKVGVVFPQTEIGPDPETLARFARTAEEAGFTFLVAYDKITGTERRIAGRFLTFGRRRATR